jgi:hypothetical protein
MAVHHLDLDFNNLGNIIKHIDNNYRKGYDYTNTPIRTLIGRIWSKKISDLKELHEFENIRIEDAIDDEVDKISEQAPREIRRNYDTYIEKIESIKNVLEEQNNDRIVPLDELVKRIKNNVKSHQKKIEKLENKLYKNWEQFTLEELTRDVIAKEKIKPQEGTFQASLLEQDYDEMVGGKRRSRKYKKSSRKNKTKKNKTKKNKTKKRKLLNRSKRTL